jgi:hypothetical protein
MTKYRARLSAAETGLYDLMLRTSELLKGLAAEAVDDVILKSDVIAPTDEAREHMHDVVTYAFTLGVQFAVNRQQEVNRQIAKKLGLVREDS